MTRTLGRFLRHNTIGLLALFVALGGTTYAATALPKNSVGAKQLKKNAVVNAKIAPNAVTGGKVKDDALTGADVLEASLGKVPAAAAADTATNATNATNATSATNATNATNAANADTLDALDSTAFLRSTAVSGQIFSGQISQHYAPNEGFFLGQGSWPVPLPAGTPTPTLEYVPGAATATCPGIGNATPGRLCVYGFNTSNFDHLSYGGNVTTTSIRYGFGLDLFPTTA